MYKTTFPVIDFHNDLLYYLTHKEGRTPYETESLSSISQLNDGHVKLQVLAIATTTTIDSVAIGMKQVLAFKKLLKDYSKHFTQSKHSSLIQIFSAIENASAFASENEPIQTSLMRLEEYIDTIGPLVYISLTWNEENRFGGGCGSHQGLKEDGKHLLKALDGRSIAVDFSHASDRLAFEILDYIDKHNLNIAVMASHSNFRSIRNVVRNLPEELAKEIIKRKGLICLNLFAPFVGKSPEMLIEHIQYGLSLGGENCLALGSDFFYTKDFPHITTKYPNQTLFFQELTDLSCYPYLFSLLKNQLSLKEETLKKISNENAINFLNRLLL